MHCNLIKNYFKFIFHKHNIALKYLVYKIIIEMVLDRNETYLMMAL